MPAASDEPGAATAARGMVAAEHALASEAGVEMFRRGGNAIDAGVAAAFAIGVLNPSSCGIGGGGFALVHDARRKQTVLIDFRETAPAAATADMFVRDGKADPKLSLRSGLAVATPAEVRGLAKVLREHGSLPLATVLEPAIRYAKLGFPVGSHLAEEIAARAVEMRERPDLAAIYLKPDGQPFREGETLVEKDLAETLERIASEGERAFYAGPVADGIVQTVRAHQGVLTAADLHGYAVRTRIPLRGRYRGFDILTSPPPAGGAIVLEVLNALSGYDLAADGAASARTLDRLARAEAAAFRDRALFYGDPGFTKVPLDRLLSPARAAEIRKEIETRASVQAPPVSGKGGTAHTSAIDRRGNAVAITTTINTSFGSMIVVPGTGIVLNDQMDDFSAAPGTPNVYGLVGNDANAIAAGKRPLSSMSPTLVLRSGKPVLAIGASGGPRIITATLQTLLHLIDFGMPLAAAVAAPRIHDQGIPPKLFYEAPLDPETRKALEALGHASVEVKGLGSVQAAQATPKELHGASDPRKGGVAAGW